MKAVKIGQFRTILRLKEAEAVTNQYRQSNAMAQLKSKHPEMEAILQDTKFAEWIQASPT